MMAKTKVLLVLSATGLLPVLLMLFGTFSVAGGALALNSKTKGPLQTVLNMLSNILKMDFKKAVHKLQEMARQHKVMVKLVKSGKLGGWGS